MEKVKEASMTWAWTSQTGNPSCRQQSVKNMEAGVWAVYSGGWAGGPRHRGLYEGHRLEHLVEQLQRPMQLHLDPARRFLDRESRVVRTPTFHETHLQDAESSQVIDADAGRRRQT